MKTDVGTTPRKPLTPRQRLKVWEAHGGKCWICETPIKGGEKWRDEHVRPLGLGGSNELSNRAPVHLSCAATKDKQDLPRIAKAKRQKMKALGIKKPSASISSRPKGEKLLKPGRIDKSRLPKLPRRALYS